MAECFEMKHLIFLFIITGFSHLQVFGDFINVAENRPATQSTTEDEQGEPLAATLAVDGDPNTCSETKKQPNNWWQIELEESKTVTGIKVFTGSRSLQGLDVHVGDDDPPTQLCNYYTGQSGNASNEDTISCYTAKTGRYIRFSSKKNIAIYLCTVEVPECSNGYFGPRCSERCRCEGNVFCNKQTGACPGNCAAGYQGDSCQEECMPGEFGLDCQFQCHCKGEIECDVVTGQCSMECDSGWIGESCQTSLPSLSKISPKMVTHTKNSILLEWDSWDGYLEQRPVMRLEYHIEFKKRGSVVWDLAAIAQHDEGQEKQMYNIGDLEVNTHYSFRIRPKISWRDTYFDGDYSREGGPYKTKCDAPLAPEIINVTTMDDSINKGRAAIIITWNKLQKEDINCDNIKWYQVMYQSHGNQNWQKATAAAGDSEKIVRDLDYSTEYRLRVVVENNEPIATPSFTVDKLTKANDNPGILEAGNGQTAIIGGIVAAAALIIIVVIIVVICRKKKSKANYNTVPTSDPENGKVTLNNLVKEKSGTPTDDSGVVEGSSDITPTSLGVLDNGISNHRPSDQPPRPAPRQPPREHRAIPVEELEDYVNARREKDRAELRNEYRDLPDGFTDAYDHGSLPENKHKNRFVNVVAYDHSRVILDTIEGAPDSDYINANYIDGYARPRGYIASQGCNKFTIQDMWRMVWQMKSHRIVMVTNLVENGKRKCEQYWLDQENEEKLYGDIGATLLDMEVTSDFVIRTFNLRVGAENRNVKQFHFTAWPDHGVPTQASPIITFRRKVRSYDESHLGTIVIHCSAGVGRTGTFIALDSLLDQAKAEGTVDIFGFTKNMRKDRVNMIQTVEQYIFVYDALLEALKSGNTAIGCSEFKERYDELCRVDPETEKSKLMLEYETLQKMSVGVNPEECKSGTLTENKEKNRCAEKLPSDRHRPYLMTRVAGTNDYINAVFLDGHRSKNQYIISQMPLPHTVIDLWRMVYEHNCGSIVMLNPWDEQIESYGQYWPDENEECECGPFMIGVVNVDRSTNPEVTVRELTLQYTAGQKPEGGEKTRTVNQFQLRCWPKDLSTPTSKAAMINLIDLVDRSQLKTGNGPVLIHCHDGGMQSGLYAAVSCVWEKMKIDQEVDIYHTVKQLRFHMPNLVENLEQYQFCFEMVLAYLAEFETYSNFR